MQKALLAVNEQGLVCVQQSAIHINARKSGVKDFGLLFKVYLLGTKCNWTTVYKATRAERVLSSVSESL